MAEGFKGPVIKYLLWGVEDIWGGGGGGGTKKPQNL